MKIGLMVYSQTGHTLTVAKKLQAKLSAAGHVVNLEQVQAVGHVRPNATDVKLATRPDTEPYDGLVFGSPVQGGALPPAMRCYLEQIPSLQGKRVALLLTHLFPSGWGTNQTLEKLTEICESKGATICAAGDVRWFSLTRRRQIASVVEKLGKLFA